MKIVKSIKNKTHLNEGCQALLFRFKDECGKEMSLFACKSWVTSLYRIKDLTPGCILKMGNFRFSIINSIYTSFSKAGIFVNSDGNSVNPIYNVGIPVFNPCGISSHVDMSQIIADKSKIKDVNYRFVKQ